DYAGDRGNLVLDPLDFDSSDGAALQAGQEDAPQAVSDGDAEAAFERLGVEFPVGIGQCPAVRGHAARELQPTPTHSHGNPPQKNRSQVSGDRSQLPQPPDSYAPTPDS